MPPELVVSVVALAASGVSLGWQVWSHRSTGPRVKLEVGEYGDDLVIKVLNVGRSPIELVGCSLVLWRRRDAGPRTIRGVEFPGCPRILANGSQVSTQVSLVELRRTGVDQGFHVDDLSVWVSLPGRAVTRGVRSRFSVGL